MSLDIRRYVHTPLNVNAVQVTAENMVQASRWCGGQILNQPSDNRPYILVDVVRSNKPRQSQAFVGDWILETGIGWKVYFDKAFRRDYLPALDQGTTKTEMVNEESDVPVGAEA